MTLQLRTHDEIQAYLTHPKRLPQLRRMAKQSIAKLEGAEISKDPRRTMCCPLLMSALPF
ncbi:MAG: hypothetical protein V1644_02060 [Candidatus Micrarchaeota archaeon]